MSSLKISQNVQTHTAKSLSRKFALLNSCLTFGFGIFVGHFLAGMNNQSLYFSQELGRTIIPANRSACDDTGPIPKPIPTFKFRHELGDILTRENFTRGVELGVQTGRFANAILTKWTGCEEYLLVDVWAPLDNYKDAANVDQASQNRNYDAAMKATESWAGIRRVCRNYTSSCVRSVPDEHFDFIYVDARHDFKGVYEDLVNWWPKLRPGGIMAGHDYVEQNDGPARSGQNWTVNYDGTIDETGTVVKGAVDKFSGGKCRQITVSYRENAWNTWALRK